MGNKGVVYTVGHSNHPIEDFLKLLKTHGISCVADVRSIPASRYNPQFNEHDLASFLKQRGIEYIYLGTEFGARQTGPDVLNEDGKVDFKKVQGSPQFKRGVKRIKDGISKGFKIALMCSEANPLDCHRFSMISGYMEDTGIQVRHILKDGALKSQKELEEENLIKREGNNLLLFPQDSEQAASNWHNKKIGWKVG